MLVGNNDIQYVDIPGFPIRYGSLTFLDYEVGQYTSVNEGGAFSGEIQFFLITSYAVSNGITTYYVAVDNTGADISFRASIVIHLANGTQIHYLFYQHFPLAITGGQETESAQDKQQRLH